jgi:membrane protease YdiL (CAAX protease family)
VRERSLEEAPGSLQENSTVPPRGYSRTGYNLLLAILGLLLLGIILAQQITVGRGSEGAFNSESLEAEIAIKIYYAYGKLPAATTKGNWQRQQIDYLRNTQLKVGLQEFRKTTEANPSVRGFRRLLILESPGNRPKVLKKLSSLDRSASPAEIAMWKAIYLSSGSLSRDNVNTYRSLIDSLDLGWYRHLALHSLYQRAGIKDRATAEMSVASQTAMRMVERVVGLATLVGLAGIFGFGLLLWYAAQSRGGGLPEPLAYRFSPEVRNLASGYLLETFVVYLALTIVIEVLAAIPLGFIMATMRSQDMAVYAVVLVYLISGVLSFLFLRYRVKTGGLSWEMLGLDTHNLSKDIFWGLGGYAASLPLVFVAGIISQYLTRFVQTPENPVIPLFMESSTAAGRVSLLILASVAAPFFEETFFRGALFNSFRARWGLVAGILLASAVFGLLHPLPLGFLPIFALALVLSTLSYRRGSLIPGMVTHALNNAVAFAMLIALAGW